MFINAAASAAVVSNQGPPHTSTLKALAFSFETHTHTHAHGHPGNETGGLSVGTDGFTASIDGYLEGGGCGGGGGELDVRGVSETEA